jgi:TolB protein
MTRKPLAYVAVVGMTLALGCNSPGRGNKGPGPGDGTQMMPKPATAFTGTVIGPGAPADAPTKFGGAVDGNLSPSWVYPPDGTLIPPNMNVLELQFTRASGQDLFELSFDGPLVAVKIYVTCNPLPGGCGFLPDEDTWRHITDAARDTTLQMKVRSTSLSGGAVGVSPSRSLSFSDEDLLGGIYYWAAAEGQINRYDFGLRGQKAEKFYDAGMAGGAVCVGCHAISRDGARMGVGLNAPTPNATLRVLDVATRMTAFESQGLGFQGGGSNFEALAPDGSKILMNDGPNLTMKDTASGMTVGTAPTIMNANQPDWSADGGKLVYARPTNGCAGPMLPGFPSICGPGVDAASLVSASLSGSTVSNEQVLVQGGSGNNNYYPTFSPDGQWIAYNHAAANSYDAPDAKVMLVPAGGGNPQEFTAVNVTVGNSWPKFAPFLQHFQGKTVYWLTFSSRRDYGLRLVNSGKDMKSQTAQIWMVAVSPDRFEVPGDPGFPAFWLPFQDLATGNHIAQWSQKIVRQPCSSIDQTGCQAGESCMNGVCIGATIQ